MPMARQTSKTTPGSRSCAQRWGDLAREGASAPEGVTGPQKDQYAQGIGGGCLRQVGIERLVVGAESLHHDIESKAQPQRRFFNARKLPRTAQLYQQDQQGEDNYQIEKEG